MASLSHLRVLSAQTVPPERNDGIRYSTDTFLLSTVEPFLDAYLNQTPRHRKVRVPPASFPAKNYQLIPTWNLAYICLEILRDYSCLTLLSTCPRRLQMKVKMEDMAQEFGDMLKETLDRMRERIEVHIYHGCPLSSYTCDPARTAVAPFFLVQTI